MQSSLNIQNASLGTQSIAREKGRRQCKDSQFAQSTYSRTETRPMPHHIQTSIAGNEQSGKPQTEKLELEQPPKAALDIF